MSVGATTMASKPFQPSDREPEKRRNQYTLRLTDTERDLLEREASRRGITALNLVRLFLGEALRLRKRR